VGEEVCDGFDNNCDGEVDEGFDVGSTCLVGDGFCAAAGEQKCDIDGNLICVGEPYDCDDGDECTIDSCDPSFGCRYEEPDPYCSSYDWFSGDSASYDNPQEEGGGQAPSAEASSGCNAVSSRLSGGLAIVILFLLLIFWRRRFFERTHPGAGLPS
jgi:hypothetical protein